MYNATELRLVLLVITWASTRALSTSVLESAIRPLIAHPANKIHNCVKAVILSYFLIVQIFLEFNMHKTPL